MDVTVLLKNDHERFKRLFDTFNALDEKAKDQRNEIFQKLKAELQVHTKVEEELFYPAIRALARPELEQLVATSLEQHELIDREIGEAGGIFASEEEFTARMGALKGAVVHHAQQMEEARVFPAFIEYTSAARREELGRQIQARKVELQRGWTGAIADWFRSMMPQADR